MRRVGPGSRRVSSLFVMFALCLSLVPPGVSAQDDDPPVAASLVIHVVGSDDANLSGATFDVTDANGTTQTVTTGDGAAYVFNLVPGDAKVVQTSAPAGYIVSDVAYVTIESGGTADLWITNMAIPPDSDGDGTPDDSDNCQTTSNSDQADADGDGIGDTCDDTPLPPAPDADGDGTPDDQDKTPNGEKDSDDVPDESDNCASVNNADQLDTDGDGTGDACDQDQAAPAVSADDIKVFAGVRNNTVNGHFNGPFLSSTTASPGQSVSFAMEISNTGSEPISNITATISFPGEIETDTGGSNLGLICNFPVAVPSTVGCNVSEIPFDNLSTLGFYVHADVVASPGPEACEQGIEMTATITSINGAPVSISSTALLDLDCPEPVTPELPTVTDGSCLDGVYTTPNITEVTTPGVTYSYSPPLATVIAKGGALAITATKTDGVEWDADPSVWTVEGNTAKAEVTVIAPPCFSIAKTVLINGKAQTGPGVANPGDRIRFYLAVSNTGGSVATFDMEDAFPSYLTARLALIWDEDPWGWISCSLDLEEAAYQYSCNGKIGPGTSEAYVEFLIPTPLTPVQCADGIDNIAYLTSIAGSEVSIPSNTVQLDFVCSVTPELPTVSAGTCLAGDYTPPGIGFPLTPGINYETTWGPATRTDGKRSLTVTATKQPAAIWAAGEEWTIKGNTATATMEAEDPPCLTVAKTVSINAGPAVTSGTAAPDSTLSYSINVANIGGSVGQFSLQDTFSPLLSYTTSTGSANVGDSSSISCTNASPVPSRLILECTGVIVPGVTLSPSASLVINPVTPADCATGIDNTATLTSNAGELDSNTVHVAIDCADVVPVLPETTNGSCLNGAYTLPTFIRAATPGVSYEYDRSIEDLLANGGDLLITARLQGASTWGSVDTDTWEVDGAIATATISIDTPPCLTFTKDITSGDGPYAADDVITYDLTVTNTGTVALNGITISDPLVGDLDCEIGGAPVSLPVRLNTAQSLGCEGAHTVTQAEIDTGGPLVNIATANRDGAEPVTATATALLVERAPAISLAKSVDPLVISAPGTVTYTFELENIGNVTLTNVALVDDLVDLSAVDCDPATGVQGVPTTLAVRATVTCVVDVAIDQTAIDARQPIVNTARATSTQATSPDATATLTVTPVDGLSLVKSVDPVLVDAPGTVTFTFVIQNEGSASLTGVTLVDDLIDPATLDCDPATGIQGLPATLPANSPAIICTAPYAIDQAAIDAGAPIANSAQVTSNQVDSNTGSATVTISQNPLLGVTKVVTSASSGLDQGDVVTYEIVVTNTGNITITDIDVSDPGADTLTCESMPESLAPDESVTCTASTELSEADLLAGFYTNTVTATAQASVFAGDVQTFAQAAPRTLEATASATVTMVAVDPALTIEKTVSPVGPVSAGDTLTYTFTVSNTGNVTVEQVAIDDPMPSLVWDASGGVIGDLARGESMVVTATYVVTGHDATTGKITNVAVATGDRPACKMDLDTQVRAFKASDDCAVVSNEATVTVVVNAPVVPTEPTPGPVTTLPTTGQTPPAGPGGLVLGFVFAALGLATMAVLSWRMTGQRAVGRTVTNDRRRLG